MPYIDVNDARIAYQVTGSGPPVLLIQGVGLAGRAWKPQVEALKSRYRICVFDNRGIGSSSGKPTTIMSMAADGLAIMDALQWDMAHVAGHSMGGSIALALALSHPERVMSLGLLCTISRGRRLVRMDPSLLWHQLRCQIGTRQMRRRAFFRLVSPRSLWGAGEAPVAELERVFGRCLTALPDVTMSQVAALRKFEVFDQLSNLIQIPSFVASTTEDAIAPPSEGAAIAGAMEADFVELAGAHAVTVQNPDLINQMLDAHWKRANARPSMP